MESTPRTPAPAEVRTASRSAQIGLVVFGVVILGLLLFRGYGNRLGARPTEQHFTQQVDLNTADHSELQQVPGIGQNLADSILAHRQLYGHFNTVDDLNSVHGIGGKTVERVRPWVTVKETRRESTPVREQLVVEKLERKPALPASATASVPAAGSGKMRPGDRPLNVNTASETELQRLPGVGAVLSQRIVDARQQRPFQTIDELRRVRGIGAKTLENLRPYVITN